MLGMQAMKEHLDCKLRDLVENGSHFTFGERSTKPGLVKLKRQQKGENIATRYFVLTEVKKIHTER